jgi:hypothetical protein
MIIFLIFLFLIYSLDPSYKVITNNNVLFEDRFNKSSVGPCNDTSYNPPFPDSSCNLIIDYGKIPEIDPSTRYTKTESATCSWNRTRTTYNDNSTSCNGSRVYIYDECSINKNVYLDKVGEFNASLICNADYNSSSDNNLLDLEDPRIEIHITPSSPSPAQNYTLRFNVSDDNPNISCNLSINNVVVRNYNFTTNNSSVEINLTLPWGITEVRIYCQDKTRLPFFNGTKRSSQQTRIINRNTSQTVDINILSPDNYFSTNNLTKKPVDINFTVNNSPTHNGTCMIYVEDQIFTINYTNNSFYHIRINDPNRYLEGKYTWNISCIDSGPKNRRTTPSRVFYIDYTPPNITLLDPGNNSNISINPYNFQYRVVDQAAQDLTHKTTCINKVNADEITHNISENQYREVQQFNSSLTEGQNRWEITCTDLAGNNITLWHNFIYRDGNPPIITPKFPLYSSPPSVTTRFHISETNNFTCTVELRDVNGSTISHSVSGSGTTDINVSFGNFPSGSYSWNVTCSDNNGNSNTAGPIYFTIYTSSSPPTITCTNSSINIRDLFFPFAVLGLILILIGYYGGTILNNQDIVTGAKMELKSFIITVLIFVLITYAANSFYCNNIIQMFSNTHTTILNLSKEANKSLTISSEIYAKSAILSSVSGIEYSLDFLGYGGVRLKFNLAKKLFEFTENLVGVYNLIFDRIAGLFIANNLIQFISLYSYNFLLYIALIARVFPPTKRIGTTLLAISITFIFIAPLVYNLSLNLYVNLFTSALKNLENHLQNMNKDIDSIYQPVKQSLERLVDIADWSKRLELFWMGIKFVGFVLLQACKFIGICYPFAYVFFVPVLNYVVYPGINAILNVLWISQTVNVQIQYAGGGYSIIDSMYDSYEAASFSLAFINVLSLFFYLFNIIVIIVTIRAISLLGAGDYFLYGIEERI